MPRTRYARITDEHHVVRRCGKQAIERDKLTNAVVGLFPAAMRLREQINETYLSANWLEHCDGTKNERLKVVAVIYRRKAKRPLSLESGIAVVNAGRVREIGSGHHRNLAVRFTPSRDDPSYSRISGLPLDNSDELLVASLAEEAYQDFM